jgi:fucose permease
LKKSQNILLFILLFGTMLIFGLIENIKGVSYPLIKAEYGVSYEQQGFLVSMLSVAYVGFSVIAGIFLGRFGIKPSFLFGFAALSAGLFAVFFSPGFFLTASALFAVFAGFGFFEIGLNALASRLFVKKAALLMNMLHAFYGIGAMLGPKVAGLVINNAGYSWRYVYLFSLPLALVFFVPAIFSKFPETVGRGAGETDTAGDGEGRKSFFDALKSPLVWLLSVTLGFSVVVEMNSSNWGPMYFQDMYGLDPSTGGAAFLSAFFLVFTLSRLVCGLFVEKIGYMRTLLGVSIIILVIFCIGFFLGEKGIFVLPSLGFFIALLWPTIMAVAIKCFGKDAPVFCSAIIAVGGLINTVVQYLVGLTNKVFGSAWGYRSTVVYTVLLIFVLLVLSQMIKKHEVSKNV